MNQNDRDIFKTLIRNEMIECRKEIKDDVDKSINRMINSQGALIVLLLFIIGGSFTYTALVSTKADKNEKVINTVFNDMRTVSGVLYEENPESVILDDMHDRYSASRGVKKRIKTK